MYHSKSILRGLIKPGLGRRGILYRLKILLKKGSLPQLLFDQFFHDDKDKNKDLIDNDGAISPTIVTNNRTSLFANGDKPVHSSKDLNALACRLRYRLKLFLNKTSLSQLVLDILFDDHDYCDSNNNSCTKTPVTDNRTIGLVITDNDYHSDGSECRTLTIFYNNNNNKNNSENNADNNFNSNNNNNPCADADDGINHNINNDNNTNNTTGSKADAATERLTIYKNNNKPKTKLNSENNNDNNVDGNSSSASTTIPSDSNADNAPPIRNKTDNKPRLPSFISHPSGTVLQVLNRKRLQ